MHLIRITDLDHKKKYAVVYRFKSKDIINYNQLLIVKLCNFRIKTYEFILIKSKPIKFQKIKMFKNSLIKSQLKKLYYILFIIFFIKYI